MKFAVAVLSSLVTAQVQGRLRNPGSPRNVETLHQAILNDILPPSSAKCHSLPGQTISSWNLSSSDPQWFAGGKNGPYAELEDLVFLAEMSHRDVNDQSWTIRIGQGGNIYSFRGQMGETVAPQQRPDSPWVDEVWQAVSVNTTRNDPVGGKKYFIHQAGAYQRHETNSRSDEQSFSPSLGKYCDDDVGECGFISWGQQAHVPTNFTSGALYLSRYKDCGNGVMEYTLLVHNMAGSSETLDHLNVPWGGARASTLPNMIVSSKGQPLPFEPPARIPHWSERSVVDIDQTEGFAMFTTGRTVTHTKTIPEGLSLKIGSQGCSEDTEYSKTWGKLTIRCHLDPPVDLGSKGSNCGMRIQGSVGQVLVSGIVNWSYHSEWMYFWPVSTSAKEAPLLLSPGSVLKVSPIEPRTRFSEQQALGHVFGSTNSASPLHKTLLRWGSTNRDYTAYTVIAKARVEPGQSFSYRQYYILGTINKVATLGKTFAQESQQGLLRAANGPNGRIIRLVSDFASDQFSVILDGQPYKEECHNVCTGNTTPKDNLRPLFQIQCGPKTVVTTDLYIFEPKGSDSHMPHICKNIPTERPLWTLLGFFDAFECTPISSGFRYQPRCCERR